MNLLVFALRNCVLKMFNKRTRKMNSSCCCNRSRNAIALTAFCYFNLLKWRILMVRLKIINKRFGCLSPPPNCNHRSFAFSATVQCLGGRPFFNFHLNWFNSLLGQVKVSDDGCQQEKERTDCTLLALFSLSSKNFISLPSSPLRNCHGAQLQIFVVHNKIITVT